MDSLRVLFDRLSHLIPSNNFRDPNPSSRLCEGVESYLGKLGDANLMEDLSGLEICESFYMCCIHFLHDCEDLYNKSAVGGNSDIPFFSIFQEKQMCTCLEFVVRLGVYPLLDPGVSLPLEMRLQNIEDFFCPQKAKDDRRVEKLMKVKGAVQLPKAPMWLRKSCGRLLSRLLVYPVVTDTVNVGESKNVQNLGVKSMLLASISLCPGIIPSTGTITSVDPRTQPKMISALVNILTTIPESVHTSSADNSKSCYENYCSLICTQLLEIMESKNTIVGNEHDSSVISRFFYDTAIRAVHELCQKSPEIGKRLLLWPLIGLLREFCQIPPNIMNKESTDKESLSFDFTVKRQLASQDDLARLLQNTKDLLECHEKSSTVVEEICKLSRPLFLLLAQSIKDGNEASELESFTSFSFRECLIWILTHLLSCSNSRLNRLSLIRSWFNLPPPSLEFMPSELQNELSNMSSTDELLLAYACQKNLMFKLLPKIHLVESPLQSAVDSNLRKNASLHVPYTCVIMNENIHTVNQIQNLPYCIECLMELLFRISPALPQKHSSSEEIGSHLRMLIDGKQNEMSGQSELTTHADLFLSLISDMHFTSQAMFESLGKVNVSHDEKFITETGTVSALLASAMLEGLDDLIWPQDVNQACNLFEALFKRLTCLLQHTESREYVEFLHQMLNQLLGILAFYANKLGPTINDQKTNARDEFGRLLPLLNQLEVVINPMSHIMGDSTLNLLRVIKVTLATRGVVPCKTTSCSSASVNNSCLSEKYNCSEIKFDTKQSDYPRKLIEEVTVSITQDIQQPTCNQLTDPNLKKIFEELNDPLIPVQGHALIMLSRLLESNDSCISGHEQPIFEVLSNYLSHADSYIYLNTIRCLSAMGCMLTDKVLNLLLNQFSKSSIPCSHMNPTQITLTSCDVEYKLKLAESIMRVLSNLGDMAPKYRREVFNTFVIGSKAPEELVRAASLSNIAELVRLLKYAVQPIIYEIFSLIEFHLSEDLSNVVRKSAAYLARSIFLSDVGSDSLPSWIPPDVIRDLNRFLSTRRIIEKDVSVKEQIEAALAQLDLCTRNSVFLKPDSPSSIVKQIRILNP
ncbi:unnamed protein product [Heterobilharzia americana]|nr:unnamed protein product [Heterobilharzia americana]